LLSRIETKPANLFQHFIEHIPVHHHLSKLEYKPPGMAHQTPTCLDESRLNTRQRPTLYRFWQSKSSHEVAQVVSQYEQRESYLVGNELVTREPRPVQRVFALFDPLLCRAAVIIEADYALRRITQVGDYEVAGAKLEISEFCVLFR